MIKENMTDKIIKRFYSITGPLDEYKRQEVDKIGNLSFIGLSSILLLANLPAYYFGLKYPELMSWAYPLFVTITILVAFFWVMTKSRAAQVTSIDLQELDEKEQKQVQHMGLKTGLIFTCFMWLFLPYGSDQAYLTELFSLKVIIGAIIAGLLFGISVHFLVKSRENTD